MCIAKINQEKVTDFKDPAGEGLLGVHNIILYNFIRYFFLIQSCTAVILFPCVPNYPSKLLNLVYYFLSLSPEPEKLHILQPSCTNIKPNTMAIMTPRPMTQ